MKNFIKNPLFTFMLGSILFCGIGVYAGTTIQAKDVTYKNTTVDKALDSLYEKADSLTCSFDEYNGSVSVTPSTISQTLSTNGKFLNSDITIGAIPSTYKNLAIETTATSNYILSGKTAYNNDGILLTGTYNPLFNFYDGASAAATGWTSNYTLEEGKYYIFATFEGTANDVTVTGAEKLNYNQLIWGYPNCAGGRYYVYLGIIKATSTNVIFSTDVNIALLGY